MAPASTESLQMINSRQNAVFEAMASPAFYPHEVKRVTQRETHISRVFLTEAHAYKIKKAVDLGFLDYTRLARRKHFCHKEVALNNRLSRNVYLGVVPITVHQGRYHLDGPGTPVEYAVKMQRLPDGAALNQVLQRGACDTSAIDRLARKLVAFYRHTPTSSDIHPYGTRAAIQTNCAENFTQTRQFVGEMLDDKRFHIIRSATFAFMNRHRALFQRRVESGKIRDCHGDLRSGHVYLHDGIQIIDCIEFNDRFRYSDVAADLAFLAMDLDFEGFSETARQLMAAFSRQTQDADFFVLLDFYKCYRAFVRVKVNCLRLAGSRLGRWEKQKLLRDTERLFNLAYGYAVRFTRPTLWIVCGLPASGKSTVAAALAASLETEVLRSDVIRKQLFGVEETVRGEENFEQGIYTKAASGLTYGRLLLMAQEALKSGKSVILDATFGQRSQRIEAMRLAREQDANIVFLQCAAPDHLIKKRLEARSKTKTVSDARLQHFKDFKRRFEPLEDIRREICMVLSTDRALADNLRDIYADIHFHKG